MKANKGLKACCKRPRLFCITVLITLLLPMHSAMANLMITPTRVTLDERQKSGVVTLLNSTKTTKTYRIELINKIQKEEGGYIDISPDASYPGNSALEFIRFSPRIVTIQPGKYQKIKLRLRMPESLQEGEYRTHLAMRVIDNNSANGSEAKNDNASGMTTSIIPRMSFSIPVIVRKGDVSIDTQISNVEFIPPMSNKAKPKLEVEIKRTGNSSSFGLMHAYMRPANSAQVQKNWRAK